MRTPPQATLVLLLTAAGCTDPQARYDAFLERSAEMRAGDAGTIQPGERFDFSGSYLAALSITIDPSQPILLGAEVSVASDLSSLDLTFQPLSTDRDPQPRMPVGESFGVDDIAYSAEGTFQAELGEVTVPGRANPISGSDIVATVTISASARQGAGDEPDLFCGQVSGMARVPIALDLTGSSMGAVAAESFSGVEPITRCPSD
ncbi:MAG TPA: hypothetical protein VJR89_36075 [Polyangiales bacterium]|nr:hypothetical protein [Polyangiales bacterium]